LQQCTKKSSSSTEGFHEGRIDSLQLMDLTYCFFSLGGWGCVCFFAVQLSAHIIFEGGVFACLEYLEAVPWAEDEEAKVTALLGQLQLESVGVAADVMKRCSGLDSSNSEDVLVRLLHAVTKGKKAHLSLPSQMPTLGSGDRKDYMI
jgi:hypothetical protein